MPHMHTLMDQLSAHVKHGDHLCIVCENADERLSAAAQYIADGLRRNEFVLYAADGATTAALRTRLANEGVDVELALSRGALSMPDADDAYLVDGQFDPEVMYAAFEQAISDALGAGFSGCRFAGEPLWALERAELRPALLAFEQRLNTLFHGKKAAGFCVYDKQTWPAEVVRDILRTHPIAVVDDLVCDRNMFYEQPAAAADNELPAQQQVDRMLAQLRQQRMHETRLQVAVAAGRLGTWELNLRSDFFEHSARFDEIFGHVPGGATWGRAQLFQHIVPDDRWQAATAFDGAIANSGECRFECRVQRESDGAVRWIEMHGRVDPPGASGATAQHLLGIISDITERKEMEQALRDTDRRKDEFLATLAHELRNPLAPIFNVLHLMQLKYTASPELQRMHGVIDRQARHLGRLVDDLLDVSRISTGRVVLQRERVDLRTILAMAVEGAQPLVDAARHTFSLSLPPEAVPLEGDATRLAQVFLNILANAVKYTPRQGRIELSAARRDGHAIIRITDNGVGMDAALIATMFDMFVQGHRAGDHAQGGLGIGLSLSKQLITLHGGTISARSEGPGMGCEVVVELPLAPMTIALEDAAPAPGSRPAGSRKVLVLDDNVDAADTLAASLAFVGHEVRTHYNGPDAIEEAMRWLPDVAVLDIGMPGMDGYEVARQLRVRLPGIVLVALTGWGQEDDVRRALAAGFDEHRTKPVNLTGLMVTIAAVAVAVAKGA